MWGGGGRVVLIALVLFLVALPTPASADKNTYLIITKDSTTSPFDLLSPNITDFKLLYNLPAIHGIVALFDVVFVPTLKKLPGVLSVTPDTLVQLETTHSWDFLGLGSNGQPTTAWERDGRFGEDTIIGNIDTGVWPESESFRDDGMSDVPSRWNGTCERGDDSSFQCNRKLIGARLFNAGFQGQSVANSTLPGQAYPIISGEQATAANQPTDNS
ncbi:hypothetical protein EJB05_55753, partial [Eragrostis curvula]